MTPEDNLSSKEIQSDDDNDDGDDTESFDDSIQPRVPLNTDPEFLDPNQAKYKYGIIYLSYIPEGLNVKILREIMGQFGEVGRIYLEAEKNNKKYPTYAEGWIEFKKKRVAKSVAKSLNGTTLQYGRKHSKMNGQMWSIKYLHRFKWTHLTEQLAHDRAVRDQKRRFEMSQAKKQVDFYQRMTDQSKKMRKIHNKRDESSLNEGQAKIPKSSEAKHNKPISQGDELTVPVNEDLLSSIFKKVT